MSGQIPFLEMFSALHRWSELAGAVQGWRILSASIDKGERSAYILLSGAEQAGDSLLREAEDTVRRAYGLNSVRLECPPEQRAQPVQEQPVKQSPPSPPVDPFTQTKAIREAAMKHMEQSPQTPKKAKGGGVIFGKSISKAPVPMDSLELDMGLVVVEGDVFALDNRDLKKRGAWVVAFDITDYTGSVRVSKFFPGEEGRAIVQQVGQGMRVRVQGRLNLDRFYGDMVLEPVSIVAVDKPMREDNAPQKRVELHLHTTMSAMDALTSVSPKHGAQRNAVKRAQAWGHEAIAVTDHGVVQSFPDAWHSAGDIKVLYGIEAYFVNDVDQSVAVHGQVKAPFEGEIVCVDIETTGLNQRYETITEIGAVILKDGEITARFQTFANPERPLSHEIIQLTGITDAMLKHAPSQEQALRAFVDFVGDRPLAAHNAQFDMGFLRAGCQKHGLHLDNPFLDTLVLAQYLLPELTKHKLDVVAEHLNLPAFSHHRASDDAATVAYMLPPFFARLKECGVETLQDINAALAAMKRPGKRKVMPRHLIILAKNQTGLRNLYKLVSLSHLEHFKRYPIMPKSLIDANREGLILGSACEAGELFQAVVKGKDTEQLKRIASWYDFLEIQPLCNNAFLLRRGVVRDEETLKDFNRTIVSLGQELGKPVCATGDVHFLDPEEERYRHILLASKGFEDADSDLPLYLKTTQEMLDEFAYLGEQTAHEVVVTNTNLVAGWCERIAPLPKGLFAPTLENSDGELTQLVWSKAHALYGETLPELVSQRIQAELGDIIGCNYDVIYMSAQKLVQNSLEHGYLVGSRGSVGSSLVAFLSGITEVNSLPAHYRCPSCKHSDFAYGAAHGYGCGADMPEENCPQCGTPYCKDGFNIPFETFLGFGGDKVPDIDLNFSGEYQASAHQYTLELFGQNYVFRAGTIGTVAAKTAFGYVKKYLEERGQQCSKTEENRLALGCTGVKRTTGQHPGGMVVIPQGMEIYDFCPVQRPADDPNSNVVTTHFEYHAMEQNLLKLDLLGHDDPTMIRMLQDLTGVNPQEIALDDPDTMSIFQSSKVLGYEGDKILGATGAAAIPEFGTSFVRGMLEDTKPDQFDILVRLSGFSHGTAVWLGNAKDLILSGTAQVREAIGCRDDIMIFLISKGMDERRAFQVMESVRKGRGLPSGTEEEMRALGVPEWYIASCKKIEYLFPKAHAVAYVMMAFRIAWFKVHRPLAFYAAYFSIRAKAVDEAFMCRGMEVCQKKMRQIIAKENTATAVEQDMLTTLEVCYEFYLRGFQFTPLDLYRSDALRFIMDEQAGTLTPPFTAVAGLGETAALSLQEQRIGREFISIEEVAAACGKLSKTHIQMLQDAGAFGNLPATSQIDLFSLLS